MSMKKVDAITMFVDDPKRSKAFYEDVFGVSAIFQDENSVAFQFENMIVNLLSIPAAHSLINPGTVGGEEAGSRFQLTVGVENVDAVCAELKAHGVRLLNGPMDRAWGLRTACFTDPDGHIWEVAHKLS